MHTILKYFSGSIIISLLGLVLAYFLGGLESLFIVIILSVLEISLSFDNAIINVKVLDQMSQEWRRRFLTWGMIIAVFGMRLVFPVLIVSVVASLSPIDAFNLAVTNPEKYSHALESSHIAISGFGGGFLLMVFLKFFFDEEKVIHWIRFIEKRLAKIAQIESIEIVIALLATFIISKYLPEHEAYGFMIAGILGIITFLVVKGFEELLQSRKKSYAGDIAKAGFATFLYLEVLDASFSFDGVIGAFALSKNIFIIMIGLGIGALFVRSLTIMFVAKKTLSQFRYLEHGAYWAIGALAAIMYISTLHEVPEIITGLIGGILIVASLVSSILLNRRKKELKQKS